MGFSASQVATASLAAQVGGAAMSTVGSYYGAGAQKSTLSAQAAVADSNARIAELGAYSALNQGQQQIASLTLGAGKLKSRQRASLAANGVDLGVGSAADLQASTDLMKEMDANTIEANAVRNAWGYRTQAMNYRNEAMMRRSSSSSVSPLGSAFGTLLGSASAVAGSWYKLSNTGATQDETLANQTSDPIYSLGEARGWWSV